MKLFEVSLVVMCETHFTWLSRGVIFRLYKPGSSLAKKFGAEGLLVALGEERKEPGC